MNCGRCGAPLPAGQPRFCTRCGAPIAWGQAPGPHPGQAPPSGPPPSSSSPVGIIVGFVAVLAVLAGAGYLFLGGGGALGLGGGPTPTPVAPPTNTPAPTATTAPGLSITIPGRDGTPTSLPIPIPGLSGTPGLPAIPGASGTPPPNAKLTAEQARQKVKDTVANCRVLQVQIETSQVTFEAPVWTVTLPITRATWKVDDNTGVVTPDERATERAASCRI